MSEEENKDIILIANLTDDGDFFYGIEKSIKRKFDGRIQCIAKIKKKQKVGFIDTLKGKSIYQEIPINLEQGCRVLYPKGELDEKYSIVIYITPDMKNGIEVLARNIKAFNLIKTFKSDELRYRKFYEQALVTIGKVEEVIRPIEQTNAQISNKVFELFESLKSMIPKEPEKKKE